MAQGILPFKYETEKKHNNLEVDIIFYDTTTASFSIDHEDTFCAFCHSKEGTWSPQAVVALAIEIRQPKGFGTGEIEPLISSISW